MKIKRALSGLIAQRRYKMDTVAKRLVGNSYQMEEAIVTVKQFHNEKTNEDVPYR